MSIVGAFIVPHPPLILSEVGRGEEQVVSQTIDSYIKISEEIASLKPETIIISSPHAPFYRDGFYLSSGDILEGDMGSFRASEVSFKETIDQELVDQIELIAKDKKLPIGKVEHIPLDHGTMVPLYFIRKKYSTCNIAVLGLSDLSFITHYQVGEIIQEAVSHLDRRVVYVASGDLSHKLKEYGPYGFVPEGPIYDEKIMKDCRDGQFGRLLYYSEDLLDKASPCGHCSFLMMAGALDGYQVQSKFYSYQDDTGVGYGICSYYPTMFDSRRKFGEIYLNEQIHSTSKDPYIALAQKTIQQYILSHKKYDVSLVTDQELLENRSGVFVSIHKFGKLRGCIGTFLPTTSCIASEIIQNAISAATEDYRFEPIEASELDYLDINVDILSTPEDIASKDDLDPKKYGVIVTSGYKRGLLLPDLEGIDDIDTQISIAMRKGNISSQEDISLKRFEVIHHKDLKQ